MSHVSPFIPDEVKEYFYSILSPEHTVLQQLRMQTDQLTAAQLRIPYEQALFLQFLIKLTNSKQVLELGTFTGYSALAIALALPEEGKIITCDINDLNRHIAEPYWQKAGMQEKIDWRIAPAIDTLAILEQEKKFFDFIFIDADKPNYPYYYEACLNLLRQGGVIAIDNTLHAGNWVHEVDQLKRTMLGFNAKLQQDDRIDLSVIPIGGGLSLIRKK